MKAELTLEWSLPDTNIRNKYFLREKSNRLLCNALASHLEGPWIQSHGMESVPVVLLLSLNVLKPNIINNRVFSTFQHLSVLFYLNNGNYICYIFCYFNVVSNFKVMWLPI
jgi:hypothetical protein